MKVAICDYKEPLNRDLEIEKSVFKKFLGEDTEISLYVHEGDNEKFKEAIKDVDGILTSYLEFPKEIINSNPNLKGISIRRCGCSTRTGNSSSGYRRILYTGSCRSFNSINACSCKKIKTL